MPRALRCTTIAIEHWFVKTDLPQLGGSMFDSALMHDIGHGPRLQAQYLCCQLRSGRLPGPLLRVDFPSHALVFIYPPSLTWTSSPPLDLDLLLTFYLATLYNSVKPLLAPLYPPPDNTLSTIFHHGYFCLETSALISLYIKTPCYIVVLLSPFPGCLQWASPGSIGVDQVLLSFQIPGSQPSPAHQHWFYVA